MQTEIFAWDRFKPSRRANESTGTMKAPWQCSAANEAPGLGAHWQLASEVVVEIEVVVTQLFAQTQGFKALLGPAAFSGQ